jgi:hypothetical protein
MSEKLECAILGWSFAFFGTPNPVKHRHHPQNQQKQFSDAIFGQTKRASRRI